MKARKFLPLFCAALVAACADAGTHEGTLTPNDTTTTSHVATAQPPTTTSPTPVSTDTTPSARPTAPPITGPATASDASKKFAASANAFGFDVYGKIRGDAGNVAFSPLSLATALAMTYGGAKGTTASEMQKLLHTGTVEETMSGSGKLTSELQDGSRGVMLKIANRLFGEQSYKFEKPFLDETEKAYGAPLQPVDFKKATEMARNTINGWVEERTDKRIKDLVPANGVDSLTRLVLVNAMLMVGDWKVPFDKERTSDEPFFASKTASSPRPTMHLSKRFMAVKKDGMTMLELDYKGGAMSMVFILPDEKDGVGALEKGLTTAKLDGWIGALASHQVSIALPKFEIDPPNARAMNDVLKELGMKTAFTPKADFTKIANPPNPDAQLYVTFVFHKAFVKVDEKGTEAAAASAVVMGEKGAAPPSDLIEFKADHPFLFMLRDKTSGSILFMGRVSDPKSK